MENVKFRCTNCGETVEKDLLPGKHTILGTLPIVNKHADCCEEPSYEDSKGYRRNAGQSVREFIPGLKA
ncbi:MAG: hypothetical protein ABEJ91_03590 [Candidatus Nanohaloarchaea archaeon]